MLPKLSPRLQEIVDALPIKPESRILEIGCGTGVVARAIADRLTSGCIVAIDRSPKAIKIAKSKIAKGMAKAEMKSGKLRFHQSAAEDFELMKGEPRFDFAFAIRVGALDGRHPEAGVIALEKISAALKPRGKLFIDGGDPVKSIPLKPKRKKLG